MKQFFLKSGLLVFLWAVLAGAFPMKSFALDFFVVLDAIQTDTRIASVDFNPTLSRLGAGLFFLPGVALEVQGSFSSSPDHIESLGVGSELEAMEIVSFRFQSPYDVGYSAFVKLGQAQFDLLAYDATKSVSVFQEQLSSGYFAVGLQKQVNLWPSLGYSLSYEQLYRDEKVKIRGLSFGYSYLF